MDFVVFSSPDKVHSEIQLVQKMFDEGLQTFHLRKPKFSTSELEEYMNSLSQRYHSRVILHTHHKLAKKFKIKGIHLGHKHRKKTYNSNFKIRLLKFKHPSWVITRSCHKLRNLVEEAERYSYVFLSPVFESITKNTHSGNFSKRALQEITSNKKLKIYALGGIDETRIEEAFETGFTGVAALSSIWETERDPLEVFRAIQDKVEQVNNRK